MKIHFGCAIIATEQSGKTFETDYKLVLALYTFHLTWWLKFHQDWPLSLLALYSLWNINGIVLNLHTSAILHTTWSMDISTFLRMPQNSKVVFLEYCGMLSKGGSRIFLRRGCASKEWHHWRRGKKFKSEYVYTKTKASSQGGCAPPSPSP